MASERMLQYTIIQPCCTHCDAHVCLQTHSKLLMQKEPLAATSYSSVHCVLFSLCNMQDAQRWTLPRPASPKPNANCLITVLSARCSILAVRIEYCTIHMLL